MPVALAVTTVWILGSNAGAFVRSYNAYGPFGQRIRAEVGSTVALGTWLDPLPDTAVVGGGAQIEMRTFRHLAAEDKLPCDDNYPRAVRTALGLGLAMPPRAAVHCPN